MKFCKDCKHFERGYAGKCGPVAHKCWVDVSLVTGEPYPVAASSARRPDGVCGIEACLFELAPPPKPTFWQRWFA